jgi:hypothetical protein
MSIVIPGIERLWFSASLPLSRYQRQRWPQTARSSIEWQTPSAPAKPQAQPSSATAPSLPDIDFDHYTLIVANAGSKPSSGFGVAITAVWVKDTVNVSVLETIPGVNCPRATELTHAEAFALIPNTHLPIRFNIMTAVVDCNAHRSVEAK